MKRKDYMLPNPSTPNRAIDFDPSICNGCNRCVDICRSDVLMPNPERKQPPIVLYPDECRYCGTCVLECRRPGAITMLHPLNQSLPVRWVHKATGESFRSGMLNPAAAQHPTAVRAKAAAQALNAYSKDSPDG